MHQPEAFYSAWFRDHNDNLDPADLTLDVTHLRKAILSVRLDLQDCSDDPFSEERINGKDMLWNPAGLTTCEGSWYNVFLAHSRFTGSTVHHELWHVMEKIITARQPGAFLIWDALNPEGFQYRNDYAAAWAEYDPDYFVSGYSTVNAMEDRATIAEAVFREDREEWFAERPAIRRKLEAMNLALKSFALIQYTLSRPGR